MVRGLMDNALILSYSQLRDAKVLLVCYTPVHWPRPTCCVEIALRPWRSIWRPRSVLGRAQHQDPFTLTYRGCLASASRRSRHCFSLSAGSKQREQYLPPGGA